MSAVGLLLSQLALPEHAPSVVVPLVEGWDGQDRPIDLTAYAAPDAAMYLYRQHLDGGDHTGIICEARRTAFARGQVRGHEAVFPERVAALALRLESGQPRTSLVSALHDAGPTYDQVVAEVATSQPLLEVASAGGGRQTVWRVPPPQAAALGAELSEAVLYVADGHHRVAASQRFWASAVGQEATGVPLVVYPRDGLRLEPFHRHLPGPVDGTGLRRHLESAYQVVELPEAPVPESGQVAAYLEGRWLLATYAGPRLSGTDGLDAVLLERQVLMPAGVGLVLTVRAPAAELAHACGADGGALFVLAPPTLDTLVEIADRGEVMPPKTTSFQPKPVTGLLLST